MILQKNLYLSYFIAGASVLVFAFNNCGGNDVSAALRTKDFGSTGCKVNNEVLVQEVQDGDYNVQIFTPEDEASHFNEKLYLNNQSNAARAPKWRSSTINWYYNPANVPANLQSTALSIIQNSMAYWMSVCNVKFNYMGTTNNDSDPYSRDNTNVVGWGDANGATGITYSYMSTINGNYLISESDVNFNSAQVISSTSLRAVANHELGHMLGLAHSDVSESIMYANPYHNLQYLLMLRADDVAGCVDLYGAAPTTVTPTPTPAPAATPVPAMPGSSAQGC